jgi:multisubunit Na+/H+ antiporter MnhB subunit
MVGVGLAAIVFATTIALVRLGVSPERFNKLRPIESKARSLVLLIGAIITMILFAASMKIY